MKQFIS